METRSTEYETKPKPENGVPIADLKVTIHSSTLVFPSSKETTVTKSMFLSNIDQVLNFNVETVHFFRSHPDFSPEIASDRLKAALERVMDPYDFLAGRLKVNPDSGRLEIDCNGAGAVFAVASSQISLDDVGDLVFPNPAFRQLIAQDLYHSQPESPPLCFLQFTSFSCGGFAIGLATNHATFDGISFKVFLENLASQAFDDESKPLAVAPFTDRHVLASRTPPRVTFPHPELLKLDLPPSNGGHHEENSVKPPVFDCPQEELNFKIFRLSSQDISSLKDKATAGATSNSTIGTTTRRVITGFNVVAAHIWRCKALSHGAGNAELDLDRESTVLYAVDLRPRLRPPLPPSYSGNAVLSAYATASCKELQEGPFSRLVEMVWEGAARMTDEYARSAIDWGELNKGFPQGEFLLSSWWRLGFEEVEYPWGKPVYSCPVVYHRKDIILLFPDKIVDGISDKGAVNVLVALPPKEMPVFQSLFYKFLAEK